MIFLPNNNNNNNNNNSNECLLFSFCFFFGQSSRYALLLSNGQWKKLGRLNMNKLCFFCTFCYSMRNTGDILCYFVHFLCLLFLPLLRPFCHLHNTDSSIYQGIEIGVHNTSMSCNLTNCYDKKICVSDQHRDLITNRGLVDRFYWKTTRCTPGKVI